ncbi:MAG: LuxR C-terminal-related transcriptional regulator [Bacteroidota bacterium]
MSPTTIETHRRNLLSKLELKNTPLLVRYAVEKGIV